MARNKKVEILSNDKEVLHPMTDGDCVIFEDGQTLTQKLSEDDSVKYTPEIVNSSPMFKVGEGNTVDYSDNVLDGAYERATLQGQTYVNYIQESSADEVTLPTPFTEYERTQHNTLTSDEEGTLGINLVGQSYVNALQHDSEEEFVVLGESLEFQEKKVEYTNEGQIKSAMLKGQTLINLSPEKTRTITSTTDSYEWLNTQINLTDYVQAGKTYLMKIGNYSSSNTNFSIAPNVVIFQTTGFNERGMWFKDQIVYTVPNEFDPTLNADSKILLRIHACIGTAIDNTVIADEIMILEYQDGMENWDIPYFEGMQSVTVSTKLENLCHKHITNDLAKNGKTFNTSSLSERALCLSSIDVGGADTVYGIKPNTKYLVQFKISNLVLDGLSSLSMQFSVSGTVSGNCLFTDGIKARLITTNGIYRVILTTTDLVSTSGFEIKGVAEEWEDSGSTSRSLTISEIMCVEYQNGMENWDLPYFEDYQVMKPVQVESVNKNLFDGQLEVGTIATADGTNVNTSAYNQYCRTKNYIKVQPSTSYSIVYDIDYGNTLFYFYSSDKAYITNSHTTITNNGTNTGKVTTPNNCEYMKFRFVNNSELVNDKEIMLEESDTVTSFVPHQSKTTYSWDEVILRKIGDVEDTLDLTTGEWVQRIGEIVLDGSDDETWQQIALDMWSTTNGVQDSFGYIYYFQHNYKTRDYITFHEQESDLYTLCDKLPVCSRLDSKLSSKTNVCTTGGGTPSTIQNDTVNTYIGIKLDKTKATTVDEFKTWLKQNPLKVHVVMNKPIVHKVNLSRPNLQTYDDITYIHTKCLDGTLIPNIYLPSDVSYPAILEPGKKYNVCVNHTEVSTDNPLKVNVGGTEITMTDSRMTLTTPATLVNSNVSFTGKGNKIKESMLIKNSSLLTRDLPHFNGIGSVQLGKTIENLCSSNGFKAGNSNATITWYDNYAHTNISSAAGSCVFVYELVKILENGKKYFVYSPQTLGDGSCITSFRQVYNDKLTYVKQQTLLPENGKCIIEIDQQDNPYAHICVGCHHDIPLNTEFDVYRPIICEYEPGMENWDWESIGYFTGTKNIGNEFMRVQNKNLFDGKLEYGEINGSTGLKNSSPQRMIIVNPIKIEKDKQYTINLTESNGIYMVREGLFYKDSTYDSYIGRIPFAYVSKVTFTAPEDGYLRFAILKRESADSGVEITAIESEVKLQVEESSTATSYTAHKNNGLYITKDQPIELTWEQGQVLIDTYGSTYTSTINNSLTTRVRNKGLLNLKPNTTYRISLGDKTNFKYHIACFDNWDCSVKEITSIGSGWVSSVDTIFTTTKDMHKISINVAKVSDGTVTPSEINHIRLEEVTDVVLRGIGDVHDELDITRGIYTQRIGEVVLDGSDDEKWELNNTEGTTTNRFIVTIPKSKVTNDEEGKQSYLCDKLQKGLWSDDRTIGITIIDTAVFLYNKDIDYSIDALRNWLQSNPITIQYELATPIVHKVHIGNKNEASTEVTKPNDVFTLPTLYTEQTHIDLTNNGIVPKVQSRDYIAYPVLPMISRTYTLQHNLTGGVSNLTVDLLGRTQQITYQNHKSLVYSPETMDAVLHNELRISGKGKISRVMYIDGGYMDRDIPYIEGMKNAVNPVVKNIGKNLYKKDYAYLLHSNTYIATHDFATKPAIKIQRNTNYIMTFETTSPDTRIMGYSDGTKVTEYLAGNMLPSHNRFIFNSGNCNGLSFYRQVNTGLTLDYKVYLSEIDIDEPYKENICYVDCGEIRLTPDMFEQGSITVQVVNIGKPYTVGLNTDKGRIRTKKPINIEPNEQYVIIGNTDKYGYSLHFLDKDENFIGVKAPYELSWGGHKPFTVASDSPKALVFIKRMDNSTITPNDADVFNFQLVKVSEIKQLRSLPHGVQDEIDLETGEYVQRVGEIVFNGDTKFDDWGERGENGLTFNYYDPQVKQLKNEKVSVFADTLLGTNLTTTWGGTPYTVAQADNGNYLQICLNKNDLRENTRDGINDYFLQNPVTVQYELATPIIRKVDITGFPHSYEGGHVIIESGNPNTPIPAQLTYRAVTNRSGQIQQHTEQVEKQEKEINELETLILANIHLSQTR